MNKEQRKQLIGWGIDPKSLKSNSNLGKYLLILLLGLIFGAMSFGILIFFGQVTTFMTDGQCSEQLSVAYNQGIVDVANFTTITGNFTYIQDNSIRNQGINEYCFNIIKEAQNG